PFGLKAEHRSQGRRGALRPMEKRVAKQQPPLGAVAPPPPATFGELGLERDLFVGKELWNSLPNCAEQAGGKRVERFVNDDSSSAARGGAGRLVLTAQEMPQVVEPAR